LNPSRYHAAALALVIWYMMAPPVDDSGKVIASARLSAWTNVGNYGSANDCEDALSIIAKKAMRETDAQYEKSKPGVRRSTGRDAISHAEYEKRLAAVTCVEVDDPRLDGN
jgi:hypothetical protein